MMQITIKFWMNFFLISIPLNRIVKSSLVITNNSGIRMPITGPHIR